MAELATSTRPATVNAAFFVWLVTVVLGLVGAVLLFVLSGAAELGGATSTSAGVGAAVYVTAGVIGIVLALVELFVVFKMRNGRNWARIVLTVLAALQVISAFTSSGTGTWTGWIGVVAVVIATILMYVPSSNPYFGRNSITA